MSRSNNTEVVNPTKRYFEWSGAEGSLLYYDKEAKKEVNVPLPFTFLLLDTLSTIKGYSKTDKSGIFSNEVRNTKTDILDVRLFRGGELAKGLYADIKEAIVSKGAKFTKSCYIAFYDESKKLVIGNISLNGSSFGGGENQKEGYTISAWTGFEKEAKGELMKKAIVMEKDERICVNGATKYFCPKFKLKSVSQATDLAALELDKMLQDYLAIYLAKKNTSNVSESKNDLAENLTSMDAQFIYDADNKNDF